MSAAGGDGPADGGHAGTLDLDTANDAGFVNPTGPVIVESFVDLSGGDARTGEPASTGGHGDFATFFGVSVEHTEVDVTEGAGTPGGIEGEVVVIFP